MLDCEQCPVRNRAVCAALSEADRADLARHGRIVTLARGDRLFSAGDDSDRCATLISGALKISTVDAEGGEHMLALIHPAGFVGELFAPFAAHDVSALTASQLCLFSRSQITETMRQHPELGQSLLQRSQEELHAARDLLALTGRRSAQARVAGLLIAISNAASHSACHGAVEFDLPLTRGEMADLLGLTIETVSRQIGLLEAGGLIRRTSARGLKLIDAAGLSQLAI